MPVGVTVAVGVEVNVDVALAVAVLVEVGGTGVRVKVPVGVADGVAEERQSGLVRRVETAAATKVRGQRGAGSDCRDCTCGRYARR